MIIFSSRMRSLSDAGIGILQLGQDFVYCCARGQIFLAHFLDPLEVLTIEHCCALHLRQHRPVFRPRQLDSSSPARTLALRKADRFDSAGHSGRSTTDSSANSVPTASRSSSMLSRHTCAILRPRGASRPASRPARCPAAYRTGIAATPQAAERDDQQDIRQDLGPSITGPRSRVRDAT